MQISFLLGPAGSGKTFRCLSEIRHELALNPEGADLIFLAPKQATFQLERQLLETGEINGYSRLHILSFDRLARFVIDRSEVAIPPVVSEQGRVMVIRAILDATADQLTLFRNCARRLGFAQELSVQFREFQQTGFTPATMRQAALQLGGQSRVAQKLEDLACVFEHYLAWLRDHHFSDGDALLTLAAELLEKNEVDLQVTKIWFDGFAQLTPQERRLLRATVGGVDTAQLAFCIESEELPRSALSPWTLVSTTFGKCRAEFEQRFGRDKIAITKLTRDESLSRFAGVPALKHLEASWAGKIGEKVPTGGNVRIVRCGDPEAEAIFCAREVLEFVRNGGRYRETAILLRGFENDYPHVLRRVFRRYGIPFFLDQRENVAHHPLAELTRGTLRTLAFHWQHNHLFTALKSGLGPISGERLDILENKALQHGWEGKDWKEGFEIRARDFDTSDLPELNRWREGIVQVFSRLEAAFGRSPSGIEIGRALRAFWAELKVEKILEKWGADLTQAVHMTVWEQMNAWLGDIELAFGGQRMTLREWIPILEAGLNGLTVGIIPPVLDSMLIGAVDRSRNPDLKHVYVLGLNEGIFPGIAARETIFTEPDRTALLSLGCELGRVSSLQVAQEQFYGYIACTRARDALTVCYSSTNLEGAGLNPSRFISHLRRMFSNDPEIQATSVRELNDVCHRSELLALGLSRLAGTTSSVAEAKQEPPEIRLPNQQENLPSELAAKLYGPSLDIAVSSVEKFAACPFKFFIGQGLRLQERSEFKMDVREQGSFQHAVLSEFHNLVRERNKHWRDLSDSEAITMIDQVAKRQILELGGGLFNATAQNRFVAQTYQLALSEFVRTVIRWLKNNRFDPSYVELPFGPGKEIAGWELPLANGHTLVLRGRIDRVDVYREGNRAYVIVFDYKSGDVKPDRTFIENGVEQQLPAYLLALTKLPAVRTLLQVDEVLPTGCFIIPLRPKFESKQTRREALEPENESPHKHRGFFDIARRSDLGVDSKETNAQFSCNINMDGTPRKGSFNAMSSEDFNRLLSHTEKLLKEFGERIYNGDISIHPYKKGAMTPCLQCQYQPICRFDPWKDRYNQLGALKKEAGNS